MLAPGRFRCGLAIEEKHVCLDALRVKNPCRKAQQCMDVRLLQQLSPDGFAGASLKQYVIGKHHSGVSVLFEDREDVLQKIELLVGSRSPKIIAIDYEAFFLL